MTWTYVKCDDDNSDGGISHNFLNLSVTFEG